MFEKPNTMQNKDNNFKKKCLIIFNFRQDVLRIDCTFIKKL